MTDAGPHFDPHERIRLATFAVGTETLAIDIMRIREIVRPLPITQVPKAPFGLRGVFNLRGRVMPLFDLKARFGMTDEKASPEERYLIVSVGGRHVGVLVDDVHEVLTVARQDVRTGTLSGPAADYFVGVTPFGEKLVLLLNLHAVLAGSEKIDVATLTEGAGGTDER